MKKISFQNMFTEYYFKYCPKIRYITQSKDPDIIASFCFKDFLSFLKDFDSVSSEFETGVIYIAVTHDLIINKLKKFPNIKIWKIPYFWKNVSITNLKKYIIGEKTRCAKCRENKCCKIYKYFDKHKTKEVNDYLVIIKKI